MCPRAATARRPSRDGEPAFVQSACPKETLPTPPKDAPPKRRAPGPTSWWHGSWSDLRHDGDSNRFGGTCVRGRGMRDVPPCGCTCARGGRTAAPESGGSRLEDVGRREPPGAAAERRPARRRPTDGRSVRQRARHSRQDGARQQRPERGGRRREGAGSAAEHRQLSLSRYDDRRRRREPCAAPRGRITVRRMDRPARRGRSARRLTFSVPPPPASARRSRARPPRRTRRCRGRRRGRR